MTVRGELLEEYDGRVLLPALRRAAEGWAEVGPPPCVCGESRHLVGWHACSCRSDTLAPGHRTWSCRGCGRTVLVGCRGAVGPGPMAAYGCR